MRSAGYPDAWRREARAEALRRYPRRLVRELIAVVKRGPRFRSAPARRWFPRRLWSWAEEEFLILRPAELLRPAEPLPHTELRDHARQIHKLLHKAMVLWGDMPAAAREYIAGQMPRPPSGGELGAAVDEFRKHREAKAGEIHLFLGQLAAAAGGAAVLAGASIEAPRGEEHTLWRLAEVWVDATGRRPTVTKDSVTGARSGAFREFCHTAMRPIWPGMGSVDGLIQKVIEEFREKSSRPPIPPRGCL